MSGPIRRDIFGDTRVNEAKEVQSSPENGKKGEINYEKIIELFVNRHSEMMYERHASVLIKLSKIYESGIDPSHLRYLAKVITLSTQKILNGASVLINPLYCLLLICLRHAKSITQSGEVECTEYMIALAGVSGIETNENLVDVSCEILHVLTGGPSLSDFSISKPKIPPPFSLSHNSPILLPSLRQDSGVGQVAVGNFSPIAKILTENLRDQHVHSSCVVSFLRVLKRLSCFNDCCHMMCQGQIMDVLVQIIQRTQDDYTLFLSIDLLWNLLESESSLSVAQSFENQNAMTIFKDRILKLSTSIRQSDKQIRNEFTILTILMLKKHPPLCTVFWDSGYTKSIKEFVVNEYEGKGNSVMTFSYDDLEFKRVCLYLLEILCRDLRVLEYLIEERFIEHLFEYLNFNSTNPVVQGWSERQLKTLQLQILRFLATLFSLPSLSDQAIALSRNKLLLFYLHDAKIYDNGQPRQHQYAAGEITGLVLSVVKLIGVLGNINDDCKSALGEVGFVEELIELLKDSEQSSEVYQECLLTLAILCQDSKSNKNRFNSCNGPTVVTGFLNFTSADPDEQLTTLLLTIESIWCCIIGSYSVEDKFFEDKGVFNLLNLLESPGLKQNDWILKRHLLGCCLDLLENPKTRSYMVAWKSKSHPNHGIANLLLRLWNEEEKLVGESRVNHNDVSSYPDLIDVNEPLVKLNNIHNVYRNAESPAVNEIYCNLRAKIYGMFCILGFESFDAELSEPEKIKLLLISRYLDFTIGQVWEEISHELYIQRIRPVTPDRECIQLAKSVNYEKANMVLQKQMDIVKTKHEKEKTAESSFYINYVHTRKPLPASGIHAERTRIKVKTVADLGRKLKFDGEGFRKMMELDYSDHASDGDDVCDGKLESGGWKTLEV